MEVIHAWIKYLTSPHGSHSRSHSVQWRRGRQMYVSEVLGGSMAAEVSRPTVRVGDCSRNSLTGYGP